MYIKKIELENIKKYEKALIEFGHGVNFISGRNGAGKTTLIESIGYAIFGAPVSNKGFLSYLIRKGQKAGRIRVTFLDKDNNELIAERKIAKNSSSSIWAIKKVVNDEEEVVCQGTLEVPVYLKDHLEFYPDDDMSHIYEKIVSVPQGEMTAAFFGTETSRKGEFDPLFKLDTYRRAYDRIKLIKAINEENIKIENEIAHINGVISNKDKIKNEKEEIENNIKIKEKEHKEFAGKENDILKEYDELDKKKKELDKIANDIKIKKVEEEKYIAIKARIEKDNSSLKEALNLLHDNENDYKEYKNNEEKMSIKEQKIKELENTYNEQNELKARREKGNTSIESRKNEINTLMKDTDEDKNNINQKEKSIKELENKLNNSKENISSETKSFDIEKIKTAYDKMLDLVVRFKTIEEQLKQSILGNNGVNKEVLYLNSANNKINKIIDLSDGEIRNLANDASLNLKKAIDITKDTSIGTQDNLISDKEKIEKEITSLVIGYIKDDKLISDYNDGIIDAKIAFDTYLKNNESKSINEEQIKLKAEYDSLLQVVNELKAKLQEKENRLKNYEEELIKWINGVNGFTEKITKMQPDVDNYEKEKQELDTIKKRQNELNDSYKKYLQNIKKADDKEKIEKELNESIEKLNVIKEDLDKLNKVNDELTKSFDEKLYKELESKKEKIASDNKVYEAEINNLKSNKEKIDKQLDDFKKFEKEINKKQNDIKENNEVIEVIKKLRNVIEEAPEVISNMLIKSISNRANDIYSEVACDTNRLEWENSYELVLYDYLNGEEVKKEFKQLSGGEQMTAALAIRIAMLENLTKLKIGILDEPTTNIDQERREKLAEIISKTAENFNQLFVVSHDDTFENITQNVVQLKGGSDNE